MENSPIKYDKEGKLFRGKNNFFYQGEWYESCDEMISADEKFMESYITEKTFDDFFEMIKDNLKINIDFDNPKLRNAFLFAIAEKTLANFMNAIFNEINLNKNNFNSNGEKL